MFDKLVCNEYKYTDWYSVESLQRFVERST